LNTRVADDVLKNNAPVQWLVKKYRDKVVAGKQDGGYQAVALSCTKLELNESGKLGTKTVTSTLLLKRIKVKSKTVYEVEDHMQGLIEVGDFFSFLYHPIVCTSNTLSKDLPVLSPREMLLMRCRHSRLLDRALWALGTGKNNFDHEFFLKPDNQDYQKYFMAAIISSDIYILLRNSRDSPGYFQLMMDEILIRQRTTKEFKAFCSASLLSSSSSRTTRHRTKAALEKLKSGINPGPRDLVIVYFDNIGFKILGRHASYDQWVVIDIVTIPESVLKAAGFYQDNNPAAQISRKPDYVWADITQNLTIEQKRELSHKVVGVQDADYDRFATVILEEILFAIDNVDALSLNDRNRRKVLSCFDKIIDRESRLKMDVLRDNGSAVSESNDARDNAIQHDSITVPRSYIPNDVQDEIGGDGLLNSVSDPDSHYLEEDESNSGENNPGLINRYQQNNSMLQVEHQDLSQASTVQAILQYGLDSRERQLDEWRCVRENYPPDAEAPLAEIIVGFGCDGQPAAAARKIVMDDATYLQRYPTNEIFISHGGLHTVMKTLNASGDLLFDWLDKVVLTFRETKEKRLWDIFPTDPNQRLYDDKWCALASYSVVVTNLKQKMNRNPTPVEVNDFMVKRAIEYPICALALLELRLNTAAKLMRNAARFGGTEKAVDCFFTAIKLVLPLFAVTHKTDYVFLCQEILKQYYCASPAQKKIYWNFIFTRKTSRGTPIFHDLMVELDVMDFRKDLGKVHRKGHGTAIELLAAELPDRSSVSNYASNLHDPGALTSSSTSQTQEVLTANPYCPFYYAAQQYQDMCLWTPDCPPQIRNDNGSYTICKENVLEVVQGRELHAMMLSCLLDIGVTRVTDSFIKYCIDEPNETKRTKDKVDITKINTSAEKISKWIQQETILRTSTHAADFDDRFFTREIMCAQIAKLRDIEKEKATNIKQMKIKVPNPSADGKQHIANELVRIRTALFAKYPSLLNDIKREMKLEFVRRGLSTTDSRRELMAHSFYALTDNTKQDTRYNTITE
jgi:UDP-N-acetylglucosamine transferase subunit ALG13